MKLLKLSFITVLILASAVTVHATGKNDHDFEIVATFDASTPPGNIAISPEGRIFLSVHEFYNQPIRVVELLKDGSTKPYPNEDWAYAAQNLENGGLYGVLGLNVDQNGILWLLDTSGKERAGRLIGWNTRSESLHRIIYLARPVITENSFLNDLAIDLKHNAIYIADTGTSSIIVVDLKTGKARRVLDTSEATKAEDIDMIIDDKLVTLNGQPARLGINPITIDPTYDYVYFGAMSGTSVYRIKTLDLMDESFSENDLNGRVERYGYKPISDGITMDSGGHVYITSITEDSIGVTKSDGSYETLIKKDDLSWPDGLAVGPDNYIYATINELHRSPVLNDGHNSAKGKFKVIRFKTLSKAFTGR